MKIRWILAGALLAALGIVWAQTSDEVNAIMGRVRQLRSLPDEEWTASVGEIARQIHAMPNGAGKQGLIGSLVNLATEGDAGQATLQTIADTIVEVFPGLPERSRASLGQSLATLARYEHVKVLLDDPLYRAALEKLDAADQARTRSGFHPVRYHRQSVDVERAARQSCPGEFLGHLVPAVPQRNAGYAGAL